MPSLITRQNDLSATLREIRELANQDIDKLVEDYIWIANKLGRHVRFRYNFSQRKHMAWRNSMYDGKRPVRGWELKFRRAGITALESAHLFAKTWARDNWRAAIIAHQEDRAAEILQNCKYYYESLPKQMQLQLSKDNVFGIKYEQTKGGVLIGTAKNPIKVRGDGAQDVLLSEGAHYEENFNRVLKEISPIVPIHPSTSIIIETTGTRRGSEAQLHYQASKEGYTEYLTNFLKWLEDPEYSLPFDDMAHQNRIMSLIADTCPQLAEKNKFYKLTPGQCHQAWMFYHFQSKNDFDYFTREFPYVEDDAWTTGGYSFFGNMEINMAKPLAPSWIFALGDKLGQCFTSFDELHSMQKVDNYDIQPNIKLWSFAAPNAKYTIGCDPSYGEDGSDYSSIYVLDTYTRQTMAAYHGRTQPHETAAIMVSLGRLYNMAQLIPETNPGGGGLTLLQEIKRLHYNRIYRWRTRDSIEGHKLTNKAGWYTHENSRAIMLGEMRRMFIDTMNSKIPEYGMFRDIALLDEMRTFVPHPRTGKPQALEGCHDDRVCAWAITNQGCADQTYAGAHDISKSYHNFQASPTYGQIRAGSNPRRPGRQLSPDAILNQFMKPNMGFEIDNEARITWQ